MYLVNFATPGPYRDVQVRQNELLRSHVQDIFEYGPDRLKSFYLSYRDVIDNSLTGWGYCMWKPYIIRNAFIDTPQGSLIFYSDVADEIYNPEWWEWSERRTRQLGGRFFNLNYYTHGEWTKRDCFITMNCNNSDYWNHRQLEAGTIILQNNTENYDLMEEWLDWCKCPLALDKNPNMLGQDNLPGFMDHRTDQSILTNLIIRRGWATEYMENIRAYIRYNAFDNQLSPDKHLRR